MNRAELLELIRNDESSGVEFKRDDVVAAKLASEIAALLNLEGGHILLGVEKNGAVSGLNREPGKAEEWVMQVARDHIEPAVNLYWEVLEPLPGKVVGVISLSSNAPDKPYKAKRGSAWVTKIRVGTTTRDATREEEARMYQQSGQLRYGLKPVPGTTINDLDRRRLHDYFERILGWDDVAPEDSDEWSQTLRNLDLAVESAGTSAATIDGMLIFGANPGRFLPQSGVRAICYLGQEPDYATRADEQLKGPLVPLHSLDGSLLESGLVDRVLEFVHRNTAPNATLDSAQRIENWEYPDEVIREIVVNALIHRDYSITGTDITLSIFSDRLEVQSPGRLPNTVTIDGIRLGMRYYRNQALVNAMRDYGYMEARGMGIRKKVIPLMLRHNGTAPDLIEGDHHFTVRLSGQQPSN